ncbi:MULTISPECIES: BRO family protein [unclassified Lysinibacillus]|uniref:BRO-N domain-containing protein n=1 Tax=unclassified Lysinibacillus TaxID=2636778 RepID=UPI0024807311|nr:BRO family protein [Lysinibacillus sp. 1 U-2021]WGT39050.1 BRO family protein [Lysinibacillus sp. 1 U-2021]
MDIKTEKWLDYEIRFVWYKEEWWAVAKDVSDALGYTRTSNMLRMLSKVQKDTHLMNTLGGEQNMSIISELGIYKAIMRSERPEAEKFEVWVYKILKQLRQSSGLEGFQIFRMLDKVHQKETMAKLQQSLLEPTTVSFIKANTIANKAVSSRHGHVKSLKKNQMTPEMLIEREPILADTVDLMIAKEKFRLDLSVSKKVYEKYVH